MPRNHHAIWEKINYKIDHDLHIHSNWSQDNLEGPSMKEWAELGHKYGIHIGFADHFEMWYYQTQSKKYGTWKLTPESIESYIEEFTLTKQEFPNISLGLEIDYCNRFHTQILEFFDDYHKEFDFLIGSVHRLNSDKEITVYNDLLALKQKFGNWNRLLQEYFNIQKDLIRSNIFDGIAHPNVIFRFFTKEEINNKNIVTSQEGIKELGNLCLDHDMLLEINLSGLKKPWLDSFPERILVNHLIINDIDMYIGSDSHLQQDFVQSVTEIRKYNRILRNEWLFDNKISL